MESELLNDFARIESPHVSSAILSNPINSVGAYKRYSACQIKIRVNLIKGCTQGQKVILLTNKRDNRVVDGALSHVRNMTDVLVLADDGRGASFHLTMELFPVSSLIARSVYGPFLGLHEDALVLVSTPKHIGDVRIHLVELVVHLVFHDVSFGRG